MYFVLLQYVVSWMKMWRAGIIFTPDYPLPFIKTGKPRVPYLILGHLSGGLILSWFQG